MTTEPLAIGGVGDVATSSLLWRYGGQLHMCVSVRARYRLVDDAVAPREAVRDCAALSAADDRVPYRQSCDVWMVGACNAKPIKEGAPLTTHLTISRTREQLLDRQHRLMHGGDLGVAGYGPRRTTKWLGDLTQDGVVEIPPSFDWTKLHAAPPSQRIPFLGGGERLLLENILASRAKMRCRIPNAVGEARIWGRGAQSGDPGYPIHLVADTLGIDADSESFTVVWRGSFPIDDVGAPERMMIGAAVTDGEEIDWNEGRIMASTVILAARTVSGGTLELAHQSQQAPAVPFSPARPSQPEGEALRPATIDGAPWSERNGLPLDGETVDVPPQRERQMTVDIEEGFDLNGGALPFQASPTTDRVPDAIPGSEGPFSGGTDPAFDIASSETVETPPNPDQNAIPFDVSNDGDA